MKPTDRVNRLQDQQPTAATVLEVRWDTVLIEYEEGGQGWWPIDCLRVIDDANWPTFKAYALTHQAVNAAIAAAIPVAPAAALALPAALLRAEQGEVADFHGCWSAVLAAVPVPPAAAAELIAMAKHCHLPQAFLDALQS